MHCREKSEHDWGSGLEVRVRLEGSPELWSELCCLFKPVEAEMDQYITCDHNCCTN